jgi:hypothetical protein
MAKPPSNEYFTPVKKRTSIGRSSRTRPKNKNKRRQYVKYKLVSNARKVMAKEGIKTIIAAGCGAVRDKSRKQTKLS